jgi:glycosyltransferase involved in cell wall biosynthesis
MHFSIVVPSFSRKELSLEALNSIFNQSHKKFEILYICHGKNNYINFIKRKLNKKKLKKIKFFYINNCSLSKARNIGIKNSKYQWVAFLDDDDLWLPKKLEIVTKFINTKKFDIFYSNFSTYFFNSGRSLKNQLAINKKEKMKYLIQLSNYISGGSAAIINKKNLRDTGYFDEKMYGCEDHDFWRRALNKEKKIYFYNRDLVIYRKQNNNLGQNIQNQIVYERYHFNKLKKEIPREFKNRIIDIESAYFVRLLNLHVQNKSIMEFFFIDFINFNYLTFFKSLKWTLARIIKLFFFSNHKVSKTQSVN